MIHQLEPLRFFGGALLVVAIILICFLYQNPLTFFILSQYLRKKGIPLKYISKAVLTHVHADHDGGLLQLIMAGQKIEVIFSLPPSFLHPSLKEKQKKNLFFLFFFFFRSLPPRQYTGVIFVSLKLSLESKMFLHIIINDKF